jgi:hypothetical protein
VCGWPSPHGTGRYLLRGRVGWSAARRPRVCEAGVVPQGTPARGPLRCCLRSRVVNGAAERSRAGGGGASSAGTCARQRRGGCARTCVGNYCVRVRPPRRRRVAAMPSGFPAAAAPAGRLTVRRRGARGRVRAVGSLSVPAAAGRLPRRALHARAPRAHRSRTTPPSAAPSNLPPHTLHLLLPPHAHARARADAPPHVTPTLSLFAATSPPLSSGVRGRACAVRQDEAHGRARGAAPDAPEARPRLCAPGPPVPRGEHRAPHAAAFGGGSAVAWSVRQSTVAHHTRLSLLHAPCPHPTQVGWKHYDLIQRLETARKAASEAAHKKKAEAVRRVVAAKKALSA